MEPGFDDNDSTVPLQFYFYDVTMPTINISDIKFITQQPTADDIQNVFNLSDNRKPEHMRLRGTGSFGVSKYVQVIDIVRKNDDEDHDHVTPTMVERPTVLHLHLKKCFNSGLTLPNLTSTPIDVCVSDESMMSITVSMNE